MSPILLLLAPEGYDLASQEREYRAIPFLSSMKVFSKDKLKNLYRPTGVSDEKNGQVTVIGGSELFHGAPLLSLKVASRIVDMVFFSSPEPSVGKVAEKFKSKLFSFIWVPWQEIEAYIEKSDAALIGPGFMRYGSEKTPSEKRNHENSKEGSRTRKITKRLLSEFPNNRWVIDAGSLQVIDTKWIPENAIITPNQKELEMLFGSDVKEKKAEVVSDMAKKYSCIINAKGKKNIVCSPTECVEIPGGNPGLDKGGIGDVLAGLTVTLAAKNEPFLAASAASFITKSAADGLHKKVGTNYNADDLADKIPETLKKLLE